VAEFDLTNSVVSDTFGRLLQIATDNVVYDATGSFLDEFKISGSFTTSEYVEIINGDNQTGNKLHSRAGTLYWGGTNLESGGGGISNILEDQTPQLGGPLDMNTKTVSGSGNFLINGSGSFVRFNVGDTSNDFDAVFNLAPSTSDQDIMLVKSSSIDSFRVNKSGVASFGSFSSAPTAVTGGFYYNNTTEEFFIGVGE
jgi:hypothetical protein|tara:strand:+ start:1972 stop:2565 length:594 start_codon:yes stop_codon:yes gene_type:complete